VGQILLSGTSLLSMPPRRVLVVGMHAFCMLGCLNPNTYTTPRTLAPGAVSVTLAAEAYGLSDRRTVKTWNDASPLAPSLNVAVGLADRIELDLRLPNSWGAQVNVKGQIVRSKAFDLALSPGFFVSRRPTIGDESTPAYSSTWLFLPLLLGFNTSRNTTVCLTPGLAYGIDDDIKGASVHAITGGGTAATLGAGFDWRLTSTFALHPEVSIVRTLVTDWAVQVVAGVGFAFGAQPAFSEWEPIRKYHRFDSDSDMQ